MNNMVFIGIDPGKDGALAYLKDGTQEIICMDEFEYVDVLRSLCTNECFCVLEKVTAMPKQGVTSMFHFGEQFGFCRGILQALKIPYQLVRPQEWKKFYGISDKNRSIETCKHLFPNADLKKTETSRKDHDGKAEALLMAEYGRRLYNGEKT